MRRRVSERLTDGVASKERSAALCVLHAWNVLADRWPRVAMTLDLHHVAGLRVDSVATVLGRSMRTSATDLRLGHAWLARAIDAASNCASSSAPLLGRWGSESGGSNDGNLREPQAER